MDLYFEFEFIVCRESHFECVSHEWKQYPEEWIFGICSSYFYSIKFYELKPNGLWQFFHLEEAFEGIELGVDLVMPTNVI